MTRAAEAQSITPRVSVVLATYNAVSSIADCLDSILSQQEVNVEVLVADGGSTDGTVEVLKSYANQLYWWRSAVDHGIYDAWNAALSQVSGEYVMFLGADDRLESCTSLLVLLREIGSRRPALVTSRGRIRVGSGGGVRTIGAPWDHKRIGRRIVVCHPGMLHRRDLFDSFGHFDAGLRIVGDLEFLLRLPPDLETLDVPRVTVEVGSGGVSRRSLLERLREQREVLARNGRFGPVLAWLCWSDRLMRYPIARMLGITY